MKLELLEYNSEWKVSEWKILLMKEDVSRVDVVIKSRKMYFLVDVVFFVSL